MNELYGQETTTDPSTVLQETTPNIYGHDGYGDQDPSYIGDLEVSLPELDIVDHRQMLIEGFKKYGQFRGIEVDRDDIDAFTSHLPEKCYDRNGILPEVRRLMQDLMDENYIKMKSENQRSTEGDTVGTNQAYSFFSPDMVPEITQEDYWQQFSGVDMVPDM